MSSACEYIYDLYNIYPLRVVDSSLNSSIMKETEKGFFLITSKHPKQTVEEAKQAYRLLSKSIAKAEFKYIPIYGGCKYPDDLDNIDEYERAFVIPIYRDFLKGKMHDFDQLKQLALDLCEKFDQKSVLIFEEGKNPLFYDRDGSIVGKQESPYTSFTDTARAFFAFLKGDDKAKKFVYDMDFECYINPRLASFWDAVTRVSRGEETF